MPGSAVSVRYRTCLAVCKDAKRGALYHKRTPLYDFFRALRGDFYAPMMIGTSAAEVMHISMPVQNE